MFEDLDLNAIHEENARELIERLLNMVEQLSGELRDARAEIQRYRDEVNRLKGEQGQPKIKGNKPKPPTSDHSSEQERYKRKRHARSILTVKKWWMWIGRNCQRMRSRRAVKMWWCRI
jgi:hypothetical protein